MSRNLVICCDGTNNQFGTENTNVVRLVQVLEHDLNTQLIYYDPGVGTLPEPGTVTKIGKKISEMIDLMLATTLDDQVQRAYVFLMNNWRPEDKVFLFGFSRGAYAVRVVAAMLHHIGLLPRGCENQVPYAIRLLESARNTEARSLGDEFRRTFGRKTGDPERRLPIHFVGVWDTVSSVGWAWDPTKHKYTANNPSIATARHAISIDEHRAFFRQNELKGARDVDERWFAGVHCDVGGGYDSELWNCAFQWMLGEARNAGILVDGPRLGAYAPPRPGSWTAQQHDELQLHKWWWMAEVFPKRHWNDEKKSYDTRVNLAQPRTIADGEQIDESAIRRIKDVPSYNPRNMTKAFLDAVRNPNYVAVTTPYNAAGKLPTQQVLPTPPPLSIVPPPPRPAAPPPM
jgi:hypothetical protein